MLATKIIVGTYSSVKNGMKYVYNFLIDVPSWYKQNLSDIKFYIEDFKYKIRNLKEANFKLGLYHLDRLNLNDAIIRFKLIDKFLNKGDKQSNYLLGWCYFLKNNFSSSLYHLNKAGEADVVQLRQYIENYSNYLEIPEKIFQRSRDLSISDKKYYDNFQDDKSYLPALFIQKILDKISDLPDEYKVLEINNGIGLLGIEARKRFPDHFELTGIEVSEKMLEVVGGNGETYDELLNTSLSNFTTDYSSLKFNVILSMCGLNSAKHFKSYLDDINLILDDAGYFAFCAPEPTKNDNPLKTKEYRYNSDEIKKDCEQNNLILLGINELKLGINNKYSIYIEKSINR